MNATWDSVTKIMPNAKKTQAILTKLTRSLSFVEVVLGFLHSHVALAFLLIRAHEKLSELERYLQNKNELRAALSSVNVTA